MKLWVDDVRPAPEGWHWAKNYNEAITLLAMPPTDGISEISLDHDLGYQDSSDWTPGVLFAPGKTSGYDWRAPTGYDIVKWIVANDAWPKESLGVHSANIVGAKNMIQMIERYGPYESKERWKITCNEVHTAYGVRYTK